MHNYIARQKDADGHLDIKNDKTGETVRHLKKEGEYFVCTDFRKPGSKEYYNIDFWVNQKSGKLEVYKVSRSAKCLCRRMASGRNSPATSSIAWISTSQLSI